jgi:hypothetical protein
MYQVCVSGWLPLALHGIFRVSPALTSPTPTRSVWGKYVISGYKSIRKNKFKKCKSSKSLNFWLIFWIQEHSVFQERIVLINLYFNCSWFSYNSHQLFSCNIPKRRRTHRKSKSGKTQILKNRARSQRKRLNHRRKRRASCVFILKYIYEKKLSKKIIFLIFKRINNSWNKIDFWFLNCIGVFSKKNTPNNDILHNIHKRCSEYH